MLSHEAKEARYQASHAIRSEPDLCYRHYRIVIIGPFPTNPLWLLIITTWSHFTCTITPFATKLCSLTLYILNVNLAVILRFKCMWNVFNSEWTTCTDFNRGEYNQIINLHFFSIYLLAIAEGLKLSLKPKIRVFVYLAFH